MPTSELASDWPAGPLLIAVASFPLAAAMVVLLAGQVSGQLRRAVHAVAATTFLALALAVAIAAFNAPIGVTLHSVRLPTATLPLTIALDPLGAIVFVALALAEWAVGVFSVGYIAEGRNANGYFVLLWVSIAALNGTLLSGDPVTLFTATAFAAAALMLLVGLDFADAGAAAGLKVFGMLGLAATVGFTVSSLALAEAPSLRLISFAADASRFARPEWRPLLVALLVALVIRAGLAPLHTWVTGTVRVTLPTLGVIVGVVGVLSGATILVRLGALLFAADRTWLDVVATLGAATVVLGGLGASRTSDTFEGLTFLAIAQAGLAATALGTIASGVELAVFQILHAGLALSLLYLAVAWAKNLDGSYSTSDLWRNAPLVAGALLVGGVSVAAWPATSGYLPRALLVAHLLREGGALPALWLIAVLLGSALSSWFVLRLLWSASSVSTLEAGAPRGGRSQPTRAWRSLSRGVGLALAGLTGVCLLLAIVGPAAWEQAILPSGVGAGIGAARPPAADVFSMLLAHTALLLTFAVATALRATELGRAPVEPRRGTVRMSKQLGLLAKLGDRGLRLTESRWLDLYHVVWTVLLVIAQASAFVLDQTVGRLGRPS